MDKQRRPLAAEGAVLLPQDEVHCQCVFCIAGMQAAYVGVTGLAEETAAAAKTATAAKQKNNPDAVKSAVTAVMNASVAAKTAAAAQNQDDPDNISTSASVITIASTSAVSCC